MNGKNCLKSSLNISNQQFAVWLQFCMILRYLPIYFSLKIGYIKSEGKYKYKKIKNFFTLMKFHEYVNLISRLTFITKAACFENIAISMQFWFEIVTKFLGVRVLGIWVLTYIQLFHLSTQQYIILQIFIPSFIIHSQELLTSGCTLKIDIWPSGLLIVFAGIRSSLANGAVRLKRSWSSFKIVGLGDAATTDAGNLVFGTTGWTKSEAPFFCQQKL